VIGGAIGVAVANGTSDLPTAYKQVLAKNKIDVAAIIQAAANNRGQTTVCNAVDSMNTFRNYDLKGIVFRTQDERIISASATGTL
jgi:hypothetical protein